MASEDLLKKAVAAFNALSPEQQAEMLEEQRQSWARGNIGLSRDERGMTSPVMPRPAPAATDTGLETVEYQVRSKLNGHWVKDNFLSQQLSPDTERRELVTRSQAVELLAAERANTETALEQRNMTIAELARLEAENAALTARIKELEETKAVIAADKKTLLDLAATNGDKVTALEAKLAAAEMALEPFANAADGRKSKSVTGSVCFSQHYLLAARAVLVGKPS